MKAIVLTDQKESIQLVERPIPEIDEHHCLIKLKASALNRRDQWIREGMYPGIKYGVILGSDGCGTVVNGSEEWIGKEVIINPNINWGDNEAVQSERYSVLGMPEDGTLAEYIKVPIDRLVAKPAHLTSIEAACIPLAGLTAYRSTVKKGLSRNGKRVLITGAGGGVSQFAIDFALAAGAEVYVTSGDDQKIENVLKRGVSGGYNYKEEWVNKAIHNGGFDSIIDSAGGNQLNNYLKVVKPNGRIILYGSTTGYPEKLDVFKLFWSQAQIMGSTMGSDEEFTEMTKFIVKNNIKPTVDRVFTSSDYVKAFDRFKEPDHFGKIVLKWD